MSKRCVLNPDWLKHVKPEWSEWLREAPNDKFSFYCKFCREICSLSNMGQQAIISHSKGKKHTKHISVLLTQSVLMNIFWPVVAASTSSATSVALDVPLSINIDDDDSSASSSNILACSTGSITSHLMTDSVTNAEIIWALKCVKSHFSYNSSLGIGDAFRLMFPDSKIAQEYSMSYAKIAYAVAYGLGPHFKKELDSSIHACEEIVICFDEAFNQISQEKQMDMVYRFWDSQSGSVVTRYFTSLFLGHGTAEIILEKFKEGLGKNASSKVLQISMDGPNVNWKFYDLFKQDKGPDDPDTLEIGSCGLHVIHGAIGTGMKASNWTVKKFLTSAYYLFKDSPARHADYTSITGKSLFSIIVYYILMPIFYLALLFLGSKMFPKKCCQHRWVENVSVINRIIEILPHLKKYVQRISPQPTCSSFSTVQDGILSKLLVPQLEFFRNISAALEPFLRSFQSSRPFLFEKLDQILHLLMRRYFKKIILDGAKTTFALMSLDFAQQNFKTAKETDIGIGASSTVGRSGCSELEKLNFYTNAQRFLVTTMKKIIERCPLKYKLTRAISCLSPTVICSTSALIMTKRMDSLAKILYEAKRISSLRADRAKMQYEVMIGDSRFLALLKTFSFNNDSLDQFYLNLIGSNPDYVDLWSVMKSIFILAHGNASVESGFSINANLVVENMQHQSLISQRLIYDKIAIVGGIEKILIDKAMMHSFCSARSRYHDALELKKKLTEEDVMEFERLKRAAVEVKVLKLKKQRLAEEAQAEQAILDQQISELSRKA